MISAVLHASLIPLLLHVAICRSKLLLMSLFSSSSLAKKSPSNETGKERSLLFAVPERIHLEEGEFLKQINNKHVCPKTWWNIYSKRRKIAEKLWSNIKTCVPVSNYFCLWTCFLRFSCISTCCHATLFSPPTHTCVKRILTYFTCHCMLWHVFTCFPRASKGPWRRRPSSRRSILPMSAFHQSRVINTLDASENNFLEKNNLFTHLPANSRQATLPKGAVCPSRPRA